LNTLGGKIHIDFRSNEPIYLQIAQQIEQLISQGELKLGDQLPTVRQLATELRIISIPSRALITCWTKPA
jgi:GntR family transcriptional regulator